MNIIYDFLKKLFSVLPLVATFVIGLGKIWGFSWSTSVAGTISLIATLGLEILQVFSNRYFQEHDIVDTGHITFINPELHEDEETES